MSFIETELPCPDCGSSDGLAKNDNGSGFCFAGCAEADKYKSPNKMTQFSSDTESDTFNRLYDDTAPKSLSKPSYNSTLTLQALEGLIALRSASNRPERGITAPTMNSYGCIEHNGSVVYPYYSSAGVLVAAKIRKPDKQFSCIGDMKEAVLFGQHIAKEGGLYVTVTEGEEDALAAFQLQGSRYACVSIKNGSSAALKSCKEAYEYLNSFDGIVIDFDSDAPGQEAAVQVAELFAGKSKIVKHTKDYKDASDYLKAAATEAYKRDWWDAKEYTPDGIVSCTDMYDALMAPVQMPFAKYPWDGLNLMSYGIRPGEIITVLAGSGVGKSTFTKEIIKGIYDDTDKNIGVLSLEESIEVAGLSMMSLKSNKRFHLPTVEQMKAILHDKSRVIEKPFLDDVTPEQRQLDKQAAYKEVFEDGRFLFLDHEGHITVESVIGKMNYLARAKDCSVIVLDHISILVGLTANSRNVSEREAIDATMHELRKLVESTNVTLINVCHLRKPSEGKGHDEGRRVQAVEARGSGAIIQLSNIAWALEGNRQAEDPEERNITTVRGLKMRFGGGGGVAGHLRFDESTGRMLETEYNTDEDAL
jgi:twinkle protein